MSNIRSKAGYYNDAAYYQTLSAVYKEHGKGKEACGKLLSSIGEGKISKDGLNELNAYFSRNRKELSKEFNQTCLDFILSLKQGKIPDGATQTITFLDNEIRAAELSDVGKANKLFKKG